jgi:hypothetical protein
MLSVLLLIRIAKFLLTSKRSAGPGRRQISRGHQISMERQHMKASHFSIFFATCLTLAACGQSSEQAKPAAQAPAQSAAPAGPATPAGEAKKEAKQETPDTHGMPGMSELFKDDAKK